MQLVPVSAMGTGSLHREIDLKPLVEDLETVVGQGFQAEFHNPSMATIRLGKNAPAISIFRTGQFQIRGTKDASTLEESAKEFRELIEELDLTIPDFEFQHSTSVYMADLEIGLELEVLSTLLGMENAEYEPEQFPALIYRPDTTNATLLIFSTGKVMVNGVTSEQSAKKLVANLREAIRVQP